MSDDPAAAWATFCQRLAVLGERLLTDEFPDGPLDRAEGYHHLANQVACWLTYQLGSADPAHPALFRSSDLVARWGGPNADQVARRCRIDGQGTYRLAGSMGSCEEFVLQIKVGAVQSGGAEVAYETSASALGLGPGDRFDFVLSSSDPGDGRTWIELDADASFLHLRDYYFDWRDEDPATFVLERLDNADQPRQRVAPASVVELLEGAAHEVEHSLEFFHAYQERLRSDGVINHFGEPAPAGRGVQAILYAHSFVRLEDGEALLVQLDPADAGFWDVQLYNRSWYEPLEYGYRLTTLNHRLAAGDPAGPIQAVISADDPGIANWLETEGRREVLCTIRWFQPARQPTVDQHILAVGDASAAVEAAGRIDAAGRAAQRRQRVAHTRWRYRT